MKIFVVKHVPDPRRDEPRNVGVIVANEVRVAGRFVGELEDGGLASTAVLRKRLGSPPEVYVEWYDFWQRALARGTEGVTELTTVGRSNYYVVEAAEVWLDGGIDQSVEELAEHYYSVLVDDTTPSEQTFIERVRLVVSESGLDRLPQFRHGFEVGSYKLDPPDVFRFPYAFVNGQTRVADRVRLDDPHRVYSSLFRFEHTPKDILKVALVWPERTSNDESERHLDQLSHFGPVVDVSRPDADRVILRAFQL